MMTTTHGRITPAALAAASAVLALVFAGCSPGTGDVAQTPGPNTESSPPTSVTGGPSPGQATTTTPAPTPGDEGRPTAEAGPAACRSSELELGLGRGGAAAGTYYAPLRFTNVGDVPCVMQGFPGVSYVTGDDGHQVGSPAARVGSAGPALTLRPGETVHADVGFANVQNYDPAACEPTEVRGLRVYPPDETASLFLQRPDTGCATTALNGNQLTVRTVEPGSGGR